MPLVSAIIVTHNSSQYLSKNITALQSQARPPDQILIVDCGSQSTEYLRPYESLATIIYQTNIGFAAANNLAVKYIEGSPEYILFLNPDVILTPFFLRDGIKSMEDDPEIGALTGTLFGYDFKRNSPTGLYDSTGIFSTWYGKWYDRKQGDTIDEQAEGQKEYVPALCGALMLCCTKALASVTCNEIWNSSFFMYKEDIELSVRLTKKNWKLAYLPHLQAYHGRGWKGRSQMPRSAKVLSARNELALHWKQGFWRFLPYSFIKYSLVFFLNL